VSDSFGAVALVLAGTAARQLGWHPDAFWRATPAELLAALAPEAPGQATPLDRATLQRLMEQDHG
jgi:uncharacterized phage protein (TIGR02216 family)